MPAKTEKQRKFFGMIHGANKQGKKLKGKAGKVQKNLSDKIIKHFTVKENFKSDSDLIFEAFTTSRLDQEVKNITNQDAQLLAHKINEIHTTGNLSTIVDMFKDYYSGKYTDIPWNTVAVIILGLLYLISPVDIIPDVIPIVGQIDDMVIVKWILTHIAAKDIENYKKWKSAQLTNS